MPLLQILGRVVDVSAVRLAQSDEDSGYKLPERHPLDTTNEMLTLKKAKEAQPLQLREPPYGRHHANHMDDAEKKTTARGWAYHLFPQDQHRDQGKLDDLVSHMENIPGMADHVSSPFAGEDSLRNLHELASEAYNYQHIAEAIKNNAEAESGDPQWHQNLLGNHRQRQQSIKEFPIPGGMSTIHKLAGRNPKGIATGEPAHHIRVSVKKDRMPYPPHGNGHGESGELVHFVDEDTGKLLIPGTVQHYHDDGDKHTLFIRPHYNWEEGRTVEHPELKKYADSYHRGFFGVEGNEGDFLSEGHNNLWHLGNHDAKERLPYGHSAKAVAGDPERAVEHWAEKHQGMFDSITAKPKVHEEVSSQLMMNEAMRKALAKKFHERYLESGRPPKWSPAHDQFMEKILQEQFPSHLPLSFGAKDLLGDEYINFMQSNGLNPYDNKAWLEFDEAKQKNIFDAAKDLRTTGAMSKETWGKIRKDTKNIDIAYGVSDDIYHSSIEDARELWRRKKLANELIDYGFKTAEEAVKEMSDDEKKEWGTSYKGGDYSPEWAHDYIDEAFRIHKALDPYDHDDDEKTKERLSLEDGLAAVTPSDVDDAGNMLLQDREPLYRPKKRPTDLTENEWLAVRSLFKDTQVFAHNRRTPVRVLLNAVFFRLENNLPLRDVAKVAPDLPPWGSLHSFENSIKQRGLWPVLIQRTGRMHLMPRLEKLMRLHSDEQGVTPPVGRMSLERQDTTYGLRNAFQEIDKDNSQEGSKRLSMNQEYVQVLGRKVRMSCEGAVHKKACLHIPLPPVLATVVLAAGSQIPKDDLHEDGLEACPHVTVKYGIPDERDCLRAILCETHRPVIVIGHADIFEHDDKDVLHLRIDSPDLKVLRSRLDAEYGEDEKHPNYIPHVTVAYLKKGRGAKYVGRDFCTHAAFSPMDAVFSPPDATLGGSNDGEIAFFPFATHSSGLWPSSPPLHVDTHLSMEKNQISVPVQVLGRTVRMAILDVPWNKISSSEKRLALRFSQGIAEKPPKAAKNSLPSNVLEVEDVEIGEPSDLSSLYNPNDRPRWDYFQFLRDRHLAQKTGAPMNPPIDPVAESLPIESPPGPDDILTLPKRRTVDPEEQRVNQVFRDYLESHRRRREALKAPKIEAVSEEFKPLELRREVQLAAAPPPDLSVPDEKTRTYFDTLRERAKARQEEGAKN